MYALMSVAASCSLWEAARAIDPDDLGKQVCARVSVSVSVFGSVSVLVLVDVAFSAFLIFEFVSTSVFAHVIWGPVAGGALRKRRRAPGGT